MTWSVFLIVSALFLVSVNTEGYEAPTINNRICPAEFWRIVESNNAVYCYSIVVIQDDRSPIGNYLCRKLHEHAKLASFHSQAQIDAVASVVTTIGAVTAGLTYEFDEFVWQDGTPVNFTLWATGHPSMNDSSSIVELGSDKNFRTATLTNVTRRSAFCKMEAEPMPKCSESIVPPTCEPGWLQRNTTHYNYCYKQLNYTAIDDVHTDHQEIFENDICARYLAGSYMVSIHNYNEDKFIANSFPLESHIGFYIPVPKRHLPIEKDLFEWTDGTPVDFANWDNDRSRYCYYGCPAKLTDPRTACVHVYVYHAYTSHNERDKGWTNINFWESFYGEAIICKKAHKNCYMAST